MQAFNPYLPLNVYIPDGEPHVFGDRIYIYGSHDKANGETFCMLEYEVYSAPVDNPADWSTKGISYSGFQDPLATEERHYLYAPDAVQGKDGRYYLYYCLSGEAGQGGYDGPVGVAVSDTPDGRFEFYGHVHYSDGKLMKDFVPFDPGVINDDGVIRMYYGTCFSFVENYKDNDSLYGRTIEGQIFHKSEAEILAQEETFMGAICCTLEDDMLTIKDAPKRIIPAMVNGTDFEGHGFFEASSIRKIDDLYYFIYSSQNYHELCYATSHFPDRDFRYRGVIVSNGDIGYQGRKPEAALNATGNNHGSIVKINGQWYVFYHRQTNKSSYSRQGCAEPIEISPDGTIRQVEMTSCGLNNAPLTGSGSYPAAICCNLTNLNMPQGVNGFIEDDIPYIANEEGHVFINDISEGTVIGYKYFFFDGIIKIGVKVCGNAGRFEIRRMLDGEEIGSIEIPESEDWKICGTNVFMPKGKSGIYFVYHGEGPLRFSELYFKS